MAAAAAEAAALEAEADTNEAAEPATAPGSRRMEVE